MGVRRAFQRTMIQMYAECRSRAACTAGNMGCKKPGDDTARIRTPHVGLRGATSPLGGRSRLRPSRPVGSD